VTLDVDGRSRSFILRMPAGDPHAVAPVVVAFHPFGMSAEYMQARVPIGRAWPQAIVVYPEGSGRPQSWQNRPGDLGDRDLRFFDAMRGWLRDHACVDEGRMFVIGYSNGAGLAYAIACARSTVVAGIAIASGRLGCTPVAPVPVIMRHGTRDATIGYVQALTAAAAFSTANACKAPPKSGAPGCSEAAGCASARVVLCTDDGGHEYDPAFTAEAVDFFRRAGR
jgi:polyhydroxybutyrate depolymerase